MRNNLLNTAIFNPNWKPLEDASGHKICKSFMYMAGYRVCNVVVHTYKHIINRHYINLSDDGRAWQFTQGSYKEIGRKKVIQTALQWSKGLL